MKKRFGFILVLILLSNLWVFPVAQAAHTDAFTFMIPFQADATGANNDLADFFRLGPQQRPPTLPPFDLSAIRYVISISVLRDNVRIYYDHGEDALEANIHIPIQASTEVWGDGDPSNGAPPGYPGDVLARGDIITLDNQVPVPRVLADLYFDGGDKVVAVGGALAVTVAAFPEPIGGILFADAWELYPTSRWGTEYVIPIGEGMRPNFSRPGVGFAVMAFNIQASEDGTDVEWDLDGDGNPEGSQTMVEGENITVVGGVQFGARIQSTEPVQVHLFVKDPTSWYQARGYTMLPRAEWSNEYLAPRSSDGDYWFYNPDPNNDLDVEAIQTGGTTTFTIPAGDVHQFVAPPPAPDGVSSVRTGVHFRTVGGDPRPFYGVAALDEADAQDWGYALLPIANLSPQALVGWAPGNNRNPPSSYTGATPAETDAGRRASRVYVTALDDTEIFVDYDGDHTADRSFTLTALQELDIMDDDPAQGEGDFDMTGAFLFTNGEPFIAVWGQDMDAPPADPSIDVGTNIVPLRAPSIQKIFTLIEEGFDCGTVQQGHRVRFQLDAFNDSAQPIPDAVVNDTLPAGLTYVSGSTTVDGASVSDDTSGTTLFPLDEGGLSIGTLDPIGQSGSQRTVTYDVILPVDPATFINTASLQPETDPAIVALNLPFRPGGFEITKTLIDPPSGPVDAGQAVTFSVTISNTGGVDITGLPLEDRFDVNLLTFSGASVTPSGVDFVNGVITWDNVSPAGLAPGAQLSLSISFTANNPIPSGQTSTTNIVLSEGAQGSDGVRQAIVCGEAQVGFRAPTPTPTSTPTRSRDGNGDGDDETPTPTRPVVFTPTPPVTAVPPTPAVLFLPETGFQSSNSLPVWPFVIFPGLGILVILAIRRYRSGPK